MLSKANKMMGLLQKFQNLLPRYFLQRCTRPHLDYGDVSFMIKVFNESFHKKLESIQYNAALATSSAIQSTNTEKIIKN